jgi:arginyl-tRNA synthetase
MIESIKKDLKLKIETSLNLHDLVIEEPKKGHADLAIPLFSFAKELKKSPKDVYDMIYEVIRKDVRIDKIEFLNGFLNIYLERILLAEKILFKIFEDDMNYGYSDVGANCCVAMDYSSPNIAKSFGVGHLRSTMIGNSIKHIYKKCGYDVVGINHLGDWGTQFGKMIVAYQKWGNKELIQKNPIIELQKLYLMINEKAKQDPKLEQEARDAFRKLELNDPYYIELWNWFREESLKEFIKMYELLNVSFDSYDGEAFYNDKMDEVVNELEIKDLLTVDEGATIVNLGSDLPPALIKKSDGATLYITRDVAAALYRVRTYDANKLLYVVGNEQTLHFKQLKRVTDLMGYNLDIEHVNFGLVLVDGKKMSTREGKFKRLEDVIDQAIDDAKEAISQKNPNLADKEMVAKAVGIGAIIYNDLKNEKHLDVDFNLENMLKFEGQTGPYLQYSSVRMESILKDQQIKFNELDRDIYAQDHYFEIIKFLAQFPSIILKAKDTNSPNLIARYIMSLSQMFNSFYGKERIIVENHKVKNANLFFVKNIQTVLNEGLRLLGIKTLKEM